MEWTDEKSDEPRVLLFVTAGHFLLVLLIVIGGLLRFDKPLRPEAIKVNLVSLPASTPPTPIPTPPTPTPPTPPVPAPPTPPVPTPPTPTPAPPKPTPTPPTPPKPVVKEPKKPPQKVEKPPQKTWKATDAATIRERLKNLRPATPPQRTVASVDPNAIADRIRKSVPKISVSIPNNSPQTANVDASALRRYYDAVGGELYQLWDQPSRSEAPGNPRVSVTIVVSKAGGIISRRIATPCNISAMNSTVQAALNALAKLPPPGLYGIDQVPLEIHVDFQLE